MSRFDNIPTPIFNDVTSLFDMPLAKQLLNKLSASLLLEHIKQDYHKAAAFLYAYRGSQETFKAYRREIERLLQWSWLVQKITLTQLKRDELEIFFEFCQNPPASWIAIKHSPRFIMQDGNIKPNFNWRPFVATVSKKAYRNGDKPSPKHYHLSQRALQASFAILSSFFTYLEQEGYVQSNPVAQIRQKSKFLKKQHQKRSIRRLSELQWSYIIETALMMAQEEPSLHERTLFIMTILYSLYLRISELTASDRWSPKMGDFYRDQDGHWWFKTVSKGNKERDITVSDALLAALKRYRHSLGLSPLPSPEEHYPLIPKMRGHGPITNTRHIRKIVQDCFDRSMERLKNDGFLEDAEMLLAATVHWLRHTGISDDVKIRPREHVRDDAGHSSSAITDQYIDIELRERHASGKKKKINVLLEE